MDGCDFFFDHHVGLSLGQSIKKDVHPQKDKRAEQAIDRKDLYGELET
jgi:hypothetical protein